MRGESRLFACWGAHCFLAPWAAPWLASVGHSLSCCPKGGFCTDTHLLSPLLAMCHSSGRPISPNCRATSERGKPTSKTHSGGQGSSPAMPFSLRELIIVLKSWTWWVLSQPAARGACSGCGLSQRGIQLRFRMVGGKVKAGWKCLGTNLARLSLGPAETCFEKKVDGKAFPVLPKGYFGDILRGGWQGIKEKRIQYIFKMWKC